MKTLMLEQHVTRGDGKRRTHCEVQQVTLGSKRGGVSLKEANPVSLILVSALVCYWVAYCNNTASFIDAYYPFHMRIKTGLNPG